MNCIYIYPLNYLSGLRAGYSTHNAKSALQVAQLCIQAMQKSYKWLVCNLLWWLDLDMWTQGL